MRRLILILGFILIAFAAFARSGLPSHNPTLAGRKCIAYTGPQDIPGVMPSSQSVPGRYYGLRAVSCLYARAHGPAVILLRASDSTTSTINVLTNGDLDVATAATFCNATTCGVQELVEQMTGLSTCNLVQLTAANQPQFVFNFFGTRPAIQFTSSGPQFLSNTSSCLGQTAPLSYGLVGEMTSTSGTDRDFYRNVGSIGLFKTEIGFLSGTSTAFLNSGNALTQASTLNVNHSYQISISATAALGQLGVDGTVAVGNAGTNGPNAGAPYYLGSFDGASEFLDGFINEFFLADDVVWSATVVASLHHNQSAYWGTP